MNIQDEKEFDNKLYIIRKRIEKQIRKKNISDFYICSSLMSVYCV